MDALVAGWDVGRGPWICSASLVTVWDASRGPSGVGAGRCVGLRRLPGRAAGCVGGVCSGWSAIALTSGVVMSLLGRCCAGGSRFSGCGWCRRVYRSLWGRRVRRRGTVSGSGRTCTWHGRPLSQQRSPARRSRSPVVACTARCPTSPARTARPSVAIGRTVKSVTECRRVRVTYTSRVVRRSSRPCGVAGAPDRALRIGGRRAAGRLAGRLSGWWVVCRPSAR